MNVPNINNFSNPYDYDAAWEEFMESDFYEDLDDYED